MSRRLISIATTIILAGIVSYVWLGGSEPTEPTTYRVYHDEQGGFSFSRPSDWKEPTEKEQGVWALVVLEDPSYSCELGVFTIDFEKVGEPVRALDERAVSAVVDILAEGDLLKDFHLISSKKTQIGRSGEGGEEEAWEITFEGKQNGDDWEGNVVLTLHLSSVHLLTFLCDKTAYAILKPAYDTLKETFRFLGSKP